MHQSYGKKFQDTEGVIRYRELQKDRQCNGQMKKQTNNDLHNTSQNTKD